MIVWFICGGAVIGGIIGTIATQALIDRNATRRDRS